MIASCSSTSNIEHRTSNIQWIRIRGIGRWMLGVGRWMFFVLLAGCAVGPNFKKPAAPEASGYTPTLPSSTSSTTNTRGGEGQRFVENLDIPGQWWALFQSKPLNDLIERSLKANPDIKAAQAALKVARESVLAQKGAFYPSVTASFSPFAGRHRTSNEVSPFTASGA